MDISQPAPFVGRIEELKYCLDEIKKLGHVTHRVINAHAITGMGKTWLFYELYNRLIYEPNYGCGWLSFEPSAALPQSDQPATRSTAHDGLTQCLALSPLGDRSRELPLDALFKEYQVTWSGHRAEKATDRAPFVMILDGLSQLAPPLDVDVDSKPWLALQKQVIKPLFDQENVMIICVSQVPLRWHEWQIRERIERMSLDPLTRGEVNDLLQLYGLERSLDMIMDLTFGHPASITFIITKHLQSIAVEPSPELEAPSLPGSIDQPYHELRAQIDQLEEFPKQILKYVGVLRRVDVQTMRFLLEQIPLDQPAPLLNPALHRALSVYREHDWVIYKSEFAPFTFLRALRLTVEADLQGEHFELFQKICDDLARWYSEELRDQALTSRYDLLEWMYFSLHSLRIALTGSEQKEDRSHRIDAWLTVFRELWQRSGNEDLRSRVVQDEEIQRLLRMVGQGVSWQVSNIIGQQLDLEDQQLRGELFEKSLRRDVPRYRQELVEFLFADRLPQALSGDERAILILIATHFGESGFDIGSLRLAIEQKLPAETQNIQSIRFYMSRLNEIHAIVYDHEQRLFFMDSWLKQFLSRNAIPPSM
jgi:hypothetical protein